MSKLWLWVVGGAMMAGACGTTSHTQELAPPTAVLPPLSIDAVRVLHAPPTTPYREIAVLEVGQQSAFSHASKDEVFAELLRQAGRRGCEGLVVNEEVKPDIVDITDGRSYPRISYRGVCLQLTHIDVETSDS